MEFNLFYYGFYAVRVMRVVDNANIVVPISNAFKKMTKDEEFKKYCEDPDIYDSYGKALLIEKIRTKIVNVVIKCSNGSLEFVDFNTELDKIAKEFLEDYARHVGGKKQK